MTGTGLTLSGVVLDSPDPRSLASFYEALLGWTRTTDEPAWCRLHPADGAEPGLSFQQDESYVAPAWPSSAAAQQMQVHLDVRVTDLDAGVAHALACGATLAEFQPQDHVRVLLDPVGHPFCLYVDG